MRKRHLSKKAGRSIQKKSTGGISGVIYGASMIQLHITNNEVMDQMGLPVKVQAAV